MISQNETSVRPQAQWAFRESQVSANHCSLLVVDDEPYILPTLAALLAPHFEVTTAESADAAKAVFARREVNLVLSDQKMPQTTGVQLLEWVRQNHPKTIRLLMTGYAELDDAVEAINRGQVYHYLLKPWRTEELVQILRNAGDKFMLERKGEELLAELQRLNAQLEERVKERTRELENANHQLQQRSRELEMLALTDPLTGLLNRRAIDDVARSELKRHARYPSPLALGLIDVDHFKEVNSRYLYTGGDEVLRSLAKTLTHSLRDVDFLGRVGGEEFLVVAPETDIGGVQVLSERIRSAVETTPVSYSAQTVRVTVSVGFVVAEKNTAVDYEMMKHAAAAALGEAKTAGRNCCVIRTLQQPINAA
jgi:diguanylate cyclase (GGDEF)-like protein